MGSCNFARNNRVKDCDNFVEPKRKEISGTAWMKIFNTIKLQLAILWNFSSSDFFHFNSIKLFRNPVHDYSEQFHVKQNEKLRTHGRGVTKWTSCEEIQFSEFTLWILLDVFIVVPPPRISFILIRWNRFGSNGALRAIIPSRQFYVKENSKLTTHGREIAKWTKIKLQFTI